MPEIHRKSSLHSRFPLPVAAASMNTFRFGLSGLRSSTASTARIACSPRLHLRTLRHNRYASYQRFPGRGGQQSFSPGPIGKLQYLWANYRPIILGTGAGGGCFYVYNLEQVPISGRRRFNVLSPENEKKILGDAGYEDLLRQYQGKILPENHPYTQLVAKVVERLLPSTGGLDQGTQWAVHVIDDPNEKNAFVVPGGKVFVFSGILSLCQDENGVAAVLGHEIAHNVAHHTAERISRSLIIMITAFALSLIFDVSGQSSNFISNLVLGLPNSRAQEAEADHIGLLMMAQSCFDPEAVPEFWRRMAQAEKGAPPQFLSTHPSSYNRMDTITKWLPEAKDKYESSECGSISAYAKEFKQSSVPAGHRPVGRPSQTEDGDFW